MNSTRLKCRARQKFTVSVLECIDNGSGFSQPGQMGETKVAAQRRAQPSLSIEFSDRSALTVE